MTGKVLEHGLHRLEKSLNIEDFLEKSLQIKICLERYWIRVHTGLNLDGFLEKSMKIKKCLERYWIRVHSGLNRVCTGMNIT